MFHRLARLQSILWVVFLGLTVPSAVSAENISKLRTENIQIENELALARKKGVYVVFNSSARKIDFRIRGVTVKTLPVLSYQIYGGLSVDVSKPLTLKTKKARILPKRESAGPAPPPEPAPAAQPPATNAATPQTPIPSAAFDVKALELEDMPKSYTLTFDNGLEIVVGPADDSSAGFFGDWRFNLPILKERAFREATRLLGGRDYVQMVVHLSIKDTQALFWSLQEGMECLLIEAPR